MPQDVNLAQGPGREKEQNIYTHCNSIPQLCIHVCIYIYISDNCIYIYTCIEAIYNE